MGLKHTPKGRKITKTNEVCLTPCTIEKVTQIEHRLYAFSGPDQGSPPERSEREAEAAVYAGSAGLALDMCRGFGLPTTDCRPNYLTSNPTLTNYVAHL